MGKSCFISFQPRLLTISVPRRCAAGKSHTCWLARFSDSMAPDLAVKKKKAKRKAGLQPSTEPPGAPVRVVFLYRVVAYLTARLTKIVAGRAAAPAEQPQPALKLKKKRRLDVAPQQAAVLVWHGISAFCSLCQGRH